MNEYGGVWDILSAVKNRRSNLDQPNLSSTLMYRECAE